MPSSAGQHHKIVDRAELRDRSQFLLPRAEQQAGDVRVRHLVHVREEPVHLVVLVVDEGVVLRHVAHRDLPQDHRLATDSAIVFQTPSSAAAFWSVQNMSRLPCAGSAYQPASRSDTSATRKSAFCAPRIA